MQIEKGGVVGDDGRVHGYSIGSVIGSAAKGAGMGAVMGAGSHFISKGASKAIAKTESTWGKAGISAGRKLTNTLWSGTVLSVPEWIKGDQPAMDVWLGNIGTMGGFGLMHGVKAAPQVIRALAPVKNPVTAAERLHNRTSFMERVDNVLSAETVDTWLTKSDYAELMANGYGDFYDLFRARDEFGIIDTKTKYSTDPKTQEYKDAFARMEEFVKDERVSQRLRSKMYSMLTGRGLPISGYVRADYGETPDGEGYVATYTPEGKLVTLDIYKDAEEARVEMEKKRKTCQRVAVGYVEDYAEAQYQDKVLQKSLVDTWKELYPDTETPEVRVLLAKYYAAISKPKEELTETDAAFIDHLNRQIISNHKEYEGILPEAARKEISREYGVDIDEALRKGIDKQTARERDAVAEYVRLLAPDVVERNSKLLPESERGVYDNTSDPNDNNGGGEPPAGPTDPDVGNEGNGGNGENEGGVPPADNVPPTDGEPERAKASARMQAAVDEYDAALDALTRVVGEDNANKIINEIGAKEYLDYLKGEGISSGAEFDAVRRLIAADEAIDQANRDIERDLGYKRGVAEAEAMSDDEIAAELNRMAVEANDAMPTEFNIGYQNALSDVLVERQKPASDDLPPTDNPPMDNEPNEPKENDPKEEEVVVAGATDINYQLSDEVDENGRQFVLNSEGNIEFGRIGEDTGLTPAPILLSEGIITNPQTNAGYGLLHIEARHGDQIRAAGYNSVLEFVEVVAKNYEVIRKGKDRDGKKTYMLQLTDNHNNTLMVELSGDGTYWNINTAGIFKTSYGANRTIVYDRHTTDNQPAETDGASLSGEQSGTTPSTRMNTPTQSYQKSALDNTSDTGKTLMGNGNGTATPGSTDFSDGKGSESFSEKQGLGDSNVSALSRVPVAENGEPQFEAVDSATGWDALVEMMDGNEDSAMAIAQAQADQAGKAVDAIKKREPQKGKVKLTGSVWEMANAMKAADAKYAEDHAAWESEMDAAVVKHERWQALADEGNNASGVVRGYGLEVRESGERRGSP
ncbi:MAG: hypothetical protein ACI4AK_01885 [Lepagella sp.]